MSQRIIDVDSKFIDSIEDKKLLGLGSQLKRVTDVLLNQVQDLYDRHNKNFKASWFSFLISIRTNPDCDIKDLAELRNVSSSAVSQVVKELIKEGFVEARTTKETRSKKLRITELGEKTLLSISPELKQIEKILVDILGSKADILISELDKLENEIKAKPFSKRVPEQVKVETFCGARAKDFEKLNLGWLEPMFQVQDYDKKLLQDPKAYIIDKGGEILFAIDGSETIGTVALIPHSKDSLELSKLVVIDSYKGWSIGNLLMEKSIAYAKKNHFKEIIILTNSKLKTAISLYQNFDFKAMPVPEEDRVKYGNRADLGFKLSL